MKAGERPDSLTMMPRKLRALALFEADVIEDFRERAGSK